MSPIQFQLAIDASGCNNPKVNQPPRLLLDNGPAYIAEDLEKWLKQHGIVPLHGAPMHPQTQGKIERWHQTLKNRILLENYSYPEDLQQQIKAFVDYYNNHRYHESLNNLTPADVYHGSGEKILKKRTIIKVKTLEVRRLIYRQNAA